MVRQTLPSATSTPPHIPITAYHTAPHSLPKRILPPRPIPHTHAPCYLVSKYPQGKENGPERLTPDRTMAAYSGAESMVRELPGFTSYRHGPSCVE